MSDYDTIKSRVIEIVEELYELDPDKYGPLRMALGDVGGGPSWNTITISDLEFLVGAVWNPKITGEGAPDNPEPDPDMIDKGVIPSIIQGIVDSFSIRARLSEDVSKFDVLAYNSSGRLQKADANGTTTAKNPIGVARESGDRNDMISVHTITGSLVRVRFGSIILPTEQGKEVYLSASGGRATLTAPNGSGDRVFRLGVLAKTNNTSRPWVMWQPCFVEDVP